MSNREFDPQEATRLPIRRQEEEEEEALLQSKRALQRQTWAQMTGRVGEAATGQSLGLALSHYLKDKSPGQTQSLLEVQRRYGNRQVQRLLSLSRQADGAGEVAPEIEGAIKRKRGGGQALDSEMRGQMESAFGADFTGVRVHTDTEANTLNHALQARAFTTGQDIFFREGEYNPGSSSGRKLIAHELTHVVQQTDRKIQKLTMIGPEDRSEQEAKEIAKTFAQQEFSPEKIIKPVTLRNFQNEVNELQKIYCELEREPPGRVEDYEPLTEEQINDAIEYNNDRFTERSIRRIQGIVNSPVTGVMDETTIHDICEWQADFRLEVDGKIGRYTLRPIVQEMIARGNRNSAIWLIIDGHNLSTEGLVDIRYDSTVAANAETAGPIPGDSTVRVGPAGFAQGYAGLVHTIAHELEHVRQRRVGIANQNIREFLAEAIEILSQGMILESIDRMMNDANRALHHWNLIPPADQATHWNRFVEVRNEISRRFNAASAATQANHQATMDAYNNEVAPHGAGP